MTTNLRQVEQNTLLSERLPAVRIQVAAPFEYAGGLQFTLYNVAHVEQHHFLVADAARRVQRLLWFQFEGYLPDNQYTYDYSIATTLDLDGLTFLHDQNVHDIEADYRDRPTSDSAHVVDFLRLYGYTFSGETVFKRLVWLNRARRDELMIIYSEDLALLGYTIAELNPDDAAQPAWAEIAAGLHARALASFQLSQLPGEAARPKVAWKPSATG